MSTIAPTTSAPDLDGAAAADAAWIEHDPLDDAHRGDDHVAEHLGARVGAHAVARYEARGRREADLDEHAEQRPEREHRQAQGDRQPRQRPLAGAVGAPRPDHEPEDGQQQQRPEHRAEPEEGGVERGDIERHEDGQRDRQAAIHRAVEPCGGRDERQGDPAERPRVDVGEDRVTVELDRVQPVGDADGHRHHEHGHRDEIETAGRRRPRARALGCHPAILRLAPEPSCRRLSADASDRQRDRQRPRAEPVRRPRTRVTCRRSDRRRRHRRAPTPPPARQG